MTKHLTQEVAAYATQALLYEVALTPKPGLVDRANNGSHDDMDFYTFLDSIVALSPYFQQYVDLGYLHEGSLDDLFDSCRFIGIQAEKDMVKATKGINTHKGANFSFGVILTAIGYYIKNHPRLPFDTIDVEAIFVIVQKMTENLIQNDFARLNLKEQLSYGEKLYLDKGLTGIRGEAANGYPAIQRLMMPFLRKHRNRSEAVDIIYLRALVLLMSKIEDGNILHRGGYEQWLQVKAEMADLHDADLETEDFIQALEEYDHQLIKRHLSPGGAADLISLGIFFSLLEGLFN